MKTINDVHQQFAEYFGSQTLKPFTYLLARRMSEGHICLPLLEINEEEKERVQEIYKTDLLPVKELFKQPLIQSGKIKKPFIIHNDKMYFQRYFNYETIILEKLKEFIEEEKKVYGERVALIKDHENIIIELFSKKSADASKDAIDWQLVAAINAVINNFTIITGGPGTGKTTTVAKILSILFHANAGLKVALAAPTGKAAARMAESLKNAGSDQDKFLKEKLEGLVPSTIHRLLKTKRKSHYFKHNHENPLKFDVVIVDESSMIDTALFAKLLDAISAGTRLILLGDKDQLASVEAGSLFGDLCKALSSVNKFSSERIELINFFITGQSIKLSPADTTINDLHPLFEHIIELKHSHRFRDEEGIGKFSRAIIENDENVLASFFQKHSDKQVNIKTENDDKFFNEFIKQYASFITENDIAKALKKLNFLRVLCAVREGENGLYSINRKIESFLQQKKLIRITGEFYENRPVMVTANNYEQELFNGDVGITRKSKDGVVMVYFENADGSLKPVLPAFIPEVQTVFAMTIHKSQGSEFNKVLVVLPDKEDISILTRELLYTAVTRAREQVIVLGKKEVILHAAQRQVKRTSGISERFMDQ